MRLIDANDVENPKVAVELDLQEVSNLLKLTGNILNNTKFRNEFCTPLYTLLSQLYDRYPDIPQPFIGRVEFDNWGMEDDPDAPVRMPDHDPDEDEVEP